MTIEIIGMIWARPTSDLETIPGPAVQPEFISRITRLHEDGGFDRILVGYWTNAADTFLVAAHAGAAAPKIKLLLAHRPGFVSPTLAARKLATLDQLLGGRLALHVISGGDDEDHAATETTPTTMRATAAPTNMSRSCAKSGPARGRRSATTANTTASTMRCRMWRRCRRRTCRSSSAAPPTSRSRSPAGTPMSTPSSANRWPMPRR
jgi:hypothetical protein